MSRILLKAVRNNALWCDTVCRALGAPGTFRETLWLNPSGTPAYYPDAVTLAPAEAAADQIEAIAALVASPRASGWSVKDSFRCLDLHPLGFRVLFNAEWILWSPPVDDVQERPAELSWEALRSETGLQLWHKAWAGNASATEASGIFTPDLMTQPNVSFLFAPAGGSPMCGGILNEGAGVVGLSNVFHAGIDPEIVWRELPREAARRFPGLPVVGYEAGEELVAAQHAGFRSAGPLRVWIKD